MDNKELKLTYDIEIIMLKVRVENLEEALKKIRTLAQEAPTQAFTQTYKIGKIIDSVVVE